MYKIKSSTGWNLLITGGLSLLMSGCVFVTNFATQRTYTRNGMTYVRYENRQKVITANDVLGPLFNSDYENCMSGKETRNQCRQEYKEEYGKAPSRYRLRKCVESKCEGLKDVAYHADAFNDPYLVTPSFNKSKSIPMVEETRNLTSNVRINDRTLAMLQELLGESKSFPMLGDFLKNSDLSYNQLDQTLNALFVEKQLPDEEFVSNLADYLGESSDQMEQILKRLILANQIGERISKKQIAL